MTIPNTKPTLSKRQAIKQLWEIGNLDFKLRGKQLDVKKALIDGIKIRDVHTILCSRRFGKSFILCCWAIEICLKKKRAVIKYACPEQKQVFEILDKIMPVILDDCPTHLRPEWVASKNRYVFPNGSEIQIAAVDNKRADSLRGGHADLCIVDEAGFCSQLSYVVYSVLGPTTDTTDGNVVLASTPNYEEPMHEFHTDFIFPLMESRELIKFVLYDSPMVNEKKIQQIINRFPLKEEDPRFRCEYLCEVAIDQTKMVIPEFTEEVERDIVTSSERPEFFDYYVGGDPAAKDLTHLLFCYWDFNRQVLVFEDEVTLRDEPGKPITTKDIADGIKRKEKMLYTSKKTGLAKVPCLRIMDNNYPILLNDLSIDHGLDFIPTLKDNKEQQIDKLRRMIANGSIEINPRLKQFIFQLRSTKWKKNREGIKKGFTKTKGDSSKGLKDHHGDGVDAAIYIIRNISFNKNPYPDDYGIMSGNDIFNPNLATNVNKKIKELMGTILGQKKAK